MMFARVAASDVPIGRSEETTVRPTVSVVICSNRPGSLLASVQSVLSNVGPSFELVVVAQGGTDGWAERDLSSVLDDPRLRIVHDAGRGLSRARNIGIRETTGDFVLFTDDDCVVHQNWIAEHLALYRERPHTMMLFGTVAPPVGYCSDQGMVPTFDPDREAGSARLRGRIALGMGANMSVRRSLIERVGLFDEVLGAGAPLSGCEDFDMALRASAVGALVVADARSVVTHEGGVRSPGAEVRQLWKRDGFGLGALIAKEVRTGYWRGALTLVAFLHDMAWSTVKRMVLGRRPFGLNMVWCLSWGALTGLLHGLCQPMQRVAGSATFVQRGKRP